MTPSKGFRAGAGGQKPEVCNQTAPSFSWLVRCGSWFLFCVLVVLVPLAVTALAQGVLGMHDLSPAGTSPIKGGLSGACYYCHAPHSGLNGTGGVNQTPLWDQKLSTVPAYILYSATTNQTNGSLIPGSNSTLCLSCHDGTVGGATGISPGHLVPYGTLAMTGNWYPGDMLGTDLSTTHPFNFVLPLVAAPDLWPSLVGSSPSTHDTTGVVRLFNGNVECGSCHNPHVQNIDPGGYFLVIDNTNGALCLACHSTAPTGSGMGMESLKHSMARAAAGTPSSAGAAGQNTNPLAGWQTSIHATATNRVAPQTVRESNFEGLTRLAPMMRAQSLGHYATVTKNACASCHVMHNAPASNSLLEGVGDQACLTCHDGSSNVSPPIPNIVAEMAPPKYGHAFSMGNNPHRPYEPVLLDQDLHVSCVDCHNPHAAQRVTTFPSGPDVRPSQAGVAGIRATDGKTVVSPAVYQYQICLRCHGSSTGKRASINFGYLPRRVVSAADPLDVIPELDSLATSSHPVFHDRRSMFPQPSLRPYMLNLDGQTAGRIMGNRILCTDCHNSDDNREFGGNGPNGPHGSVFSHILERRYEFSEAPTPGQLITNLYPNPSFSAAGGASGGPYALCAKCHDLTRIMSDDSWNGHWRHVVQDGFSCSVCHSAHGVPGRSGSISGERLVDFDANVVAPNGLVPISYNRATNSCSLVCHGHGHELQSVGGTARTRR
jgi:predicted CXXCH cytochrome family protein